MNHGKWYKTGFNEGKSQAPADPPMQPGHRSHTDYMEGHADGERQRDADDADQEAGQ